MATYDFYIYSTSALVYNSGTGEFDFSASYDYMTDRYRVVVTDDDPVMDVSGDATQSAIIYDTSGTVVDSGLITVAAFAEVTDPSTGLINFLDRIEVDGVHYGYASGTALIPGTSYPVATSGTDPINHTYLVSVSVPCFGPDTLIETSAGPRPIRQITPGTTLVTKDHGLQPVLWVSAQHLSEEVWSDRPSLWPVTLNTPLPGMDIPSMPLCLSGQHRVILSDPWFELSQGSPEVLAPAAGLATPKRPNSGTVLSWHHLLLPKHEIILANDVWVESLLLGGQAFSSLPPLSRITAQAALGDHPQHTKTARPCIRKWETQAYLMHAPLAARAKRFNAA